MQENLRNGTAGPIFLFQIVPGTEKVALVHNSPDIAIHFQIRQGREPMVNINLCPQLIMMLPSITTGRRLTKRSPDIVSIGSLVLSPGVIVANQNVS